MIKPIFIGLLLFFSLSGLLQAQSPTKGLKKYNDGEFWYKLYTKNKQQPRPQEGDQVRIDYTLGKGAAVYASSHGSKHPVLVQIPPAGYDNFFTHALCLMGVGDSLLVRMPADNIPEYLGEHQSKFKQGEWVSFSYKMHSIKPAAIYQAEQERAKMRSDSIRNISYKWVRHYQQDSLAAFADWHTSETGLRYKIHQQGSGDSTCTGQEAQLNLIGFLPDASIMYDSFEAMLPVDWVVGSFDIILGVAEGACLLQEGGSIWLWVPSQLGYGRIGVPELVPPHTPLFFYLEVARVR